MTKHYSNKDVIADLSVMDEVYSIIEREESNYFRKCLQYYQLEIEYRIETFYKFFKAAKEIDRPIPKLKEDIKMFLSLRGTQDKYNNSVQNTMITNVDILVEWYHGAPDELEKIIECNQFLNFLGLSCVRLLKNDWKLDNLYEIDKITRCEAAELFLKIISARDSIILVRQRNNSEFEGQRCLSFFISIFFLRTSRF